MDKGILIRKYRREVACVLHQGVARLLITRLELLRTGTNEYQHQMDDIRGLVNVLREDVNEERQYVVYTNYSLKYID